MAYKKISELNLETNVNQNDFFVISSTTEGTRKITFENLMLGIESALANPASVASSSKKDNDV
jgi:hypothetical protein